MDTLAVVGSALALSLAAGLSLYGAAFLLGLAVRLEWLRLAPGWEPLAVLADPVVLTVAGVLAVIEFFADKVPWVDSAWDAVHTVIRPIGGALLARRVLGDLSPEAQVIAFLLLGGATFATHAAKASVRLVVNTSPEPVSNVLVSLFENGLVVGALWLAVSHPLLALGIGLAALALAVFATVWLAGRVVRILRGLWARAAQRRPVG